MWKTSETQKEEMCLLYNTGETLKSIAIKYNISVPAVSGILERRGVLKRNSSECQKKCNLDESIFENPLSDEAAYWIGFLFADGTIIHRDGNPALAIVLSEKDKRHILKFKAFLGSTHAITTIPASTRFTREGVRVSSGNGTRFAVRSHKIVNDLSHWGMKGKSLERVPQNSIDNNASFWRGVIDGDANLRLGSTGYPILELVGGFDLLDRFLIFCYKNGIDTKSNVKRHKSIYRISFHGSAAEKSIKLLYFNSTVHLDRKYNAAINILKKGMKILGVEWQKNSTSGQEESAEQSGKHGEKTANTIEGQPDIALRFSVNHELESPCVHAGEYVKAFDKINDLM